jgi:hypothetical protein
MDVLLSMTTGIWNSVGPTTWLLVLGLLGSITLLRKTLL